MILQNNFEGVIEKVKGRLKVRFFYSQRFIIKVVH